MLPSILLSSLGMGAVFMPLTLIATTGLEDDDQGLASGLFNTSQQIGGALGLAILSTIAASKTAVGRLRRRHAALVTGFHWAFAGGRGRSMLAGARRDGRDAARSVTSRGSRRRPRPASPWWSKRR